MSEPNAGAADAGGTDVGTGDASHRKSYWQQQANDAAARPKMAATKTVRSSALLTLTWSVYSVLALIGTVLELPEVKWFQVAMVVVGLVSVVMYANSTRVLGKNRRQHPGSQPPLAPQDA